MTKDDITSQHSDIELLDCLSCILNDITDIQYSNIVFGGDMNIDFSNSSHIGSIMLMI